jgi:hypothetical protein
MQAEQGRRLRQVEARSGKRRSVRAVLVLALLSADLRPHKHVTTAHSVVGSSKPPVLMQIVGVLVIGKKRDDWNASAGTVTDVAGCRVDRDD